MENIPEILNYQGKAYRVISASPERDYRLAQRAEYPASGRFGASADDPILLFHIENGLLKAIGQADDPFVLEDGPFLYDIVWCEAFVVLRYCAADNSGVRDIRIPYKRER